MNKITKIVAGIVTAGALALGGGAAYAAGAYRAETTASTTTEPISYGACVSQKTGSVRVLERSNLAKSRYGACKQDGSEKFVLLGSGNAVVQTKLPEQFAVTLKVGDKNEFHVCTTVKSVKLRTKTATGYAKAIEPARYACTEAVQPKDVPTTPAG